MQHHAAFSGTQEDRVLAVVHRDLRNRDVLAFLQRLGQQRVRTPPCLLRHHVIRRLEVNRVHFSALHEFENLHRFRGLRLDLFDLVRFDDNVFVLAELIALYDLTAIDNLAIGLAYVLLLEA